MKLLTLLSLALPTVMLPIAPPDATDIVKRSVGVLDRDWRAAPDYSFVEDDIEIKNGTRSERKSAVVMIDRSPYWMLLAENGLSLTAGSRRRRAAKTGTTGFCSAQPIPSRPSPQNCEV